MQPKEILSNKNLNLVTGEKKALFFPRDNFGLLVGSKDDTNDLKLCRNIFDLGGMSSQTFHYIKIKTKKIRAQ